MQRFRRQRLPPQVRKQRPRFIVDRRFQKVDTAAPQLLARVAPQDFQRLTTIFGDNKYHNHSLAAWLTKERPAWHIEVQSRPESATGFAPVRKRWVVERTNAWEGRSRRNSKDYERLVSSSEAMLEISACHLMLCRLTPQLDVPKFRYRAAKLAA